MTISNLTSILQTIKSQMQDSGGRRRNKKPSAQLLLGMYQKLIKLLVSPYMKLLTQAYSMLCTLHTFPEFFWRNFGLFLLSFCLPFTAPMSYITLEYCENEHQNHCAKSLSWSPCFHFSNPLPTVAKVTDWKPKTDHPTSLLRILQWLSVTSEGNLSPAPQLLPTTYSPLLPAERQPRWLFSVSASGIWNLVFPLPGMLACDCYFFCVCMTATFISSGLCLDLLSSAKWPLPD